MGFYSPDLARHFRFDSPLPNCLNLAVHVFSRQTPQIAYSDSNEGLIDVGLLEGDADELISSGAHQPYYMHRTSHWLGLDVHDVGTYSEAGEPRALEPSMVFTVEPGIYVPDDDEKVSAEFRGIGVRIEDDVVITAESFENLTGAIPKRPADLEAWMRDAS